MKYTIRAIKYFFYFAFLTSAIIAILVFIGAVEGNIEAIFEGGYDALWKIAIFFAVVAAVYPKLGFIKTVVPVHSEEEETKKEIIGFFKSRRYIQESESNGTITFRYKDMVGRISKMFEDRITLTRTEGGYEMEGLRKDVMKLAAGLEHHLTAKE